MNRTAQIRINPNMRVNKVFSQDSDAKNEKQVSLFSNSCKVPTENDLNLLSTVNPPPDNNDTILAAQQPDTLRMFKNPKDMIVIEFYSNGKPHYVKDFYDNVMIKKTEYTGAGIIVAVDEYKDGVLRKHTENYPGTGEQWIIEEYTEKGKPLRIYEYAPYNKLIDYKAFPVEE